MSEEKLKFREIKGLIIQDVAQKAEEFGHSFNVNS